MIDALEDVMAFEILSDFGSLSKLGSACITTFEVAVSEIIICLTYCFEDREGSETFCYVFDDRTVLVAEESHPIVHGMNIQN